MALNDQTKRILAVGIFVVSVIAIGAALYFTFFYHPAPPAEVTPTPTPTPTQPGGALPTGQPAQPTTPQPTTTPSALGVPSPVASGGLTKTTQLTSAPVEGLVLSSGGSAVNYYDPTDGRFYTIDANGNVVRLSDQTFPSATGANWNANGTKAVIRFPDQSQIVYDFQNKTQVTLPSFWQDTQFSPVGDQLIAKSMAVDAASQWLVTANADGSNIRPVQALGTNADKVTVAWSPNNQVIAFADTADTNIGVDQKMIIPIGKNQENFKGLTVEGINFEPSWSPDGSKLLYSASGDFSNGKPLLWLTGATPSTMDQNRKSLGLNTWADKCTFADSNTVYCAVPTSLPDNADFARSLYQNTPDQLYKVNVATGTTSLVAIPAGQGQQGTQTMTNLVVSKDGSSLFYTDGNTGLLNSLRLK